MDKEGFSYYSRQLKLNHNMGIIVEVLRRIDHLMICLVARDLKKKEIFFLSFLFSIQKIRQSFSVRLHLPGRTPKSGILFNLQLAMLINRSGADIGLEIFCFR